MVTSSADIIDIIDAQVCICVAQYSQMASDSGACKPVAVYAALMYSGFQAGITPLRQLSRWSDSVAIDARHARNDTHRGSLPAQ